MRRPAPSSQLDLLDWQPPSPVLAFDPVSIRAASLKSKVAKAIAVALKEVKAPRGAVTRRMSEYLGEPVPESAINHYASEASEDHIINVVRFIALIEATGDRRLLEFIAELFGWAVIERKFLPAIELAAIHERKDEINRMLANARHQAKQAGAI